MNYEILESLTAVGYVDVTSKNSISQLFHYFSYDGSFLDENVFSEALNEGFANEQFRCLVIWFANEISKLAKMEENVRTILGFLFKF